LINSDDEDDGKFGVGDGEEVDGTVDAEVGGWGSRPASRASGTDARSVADGGGKAAGTVKRIAPLSSSSSSTRCHTSTHLTLISRPKKGQRERSPDSARNRIGNVMAMMMMNQASDRDKRREKRDERCQEIHIQVEMQCQQMQQQQNMMALMLMNMMGQNNGQNSPSIIWAHY
jgi:hypothetical protein